MKGVKLGPAIKIFNVWKSRFVLGTGGYLDHVDPGLA